MSTSSAQTYSRNCGMKRMWKRERKRMRKRIRKRMRKRIRKST